MIGNILTVNAKNYDFHQLYHYKKNQHLLLEQWLEQTLDAHDENDLDHCL